MAIFLLCVPVCERRMSCFLRVATPHLRDAALRLYPYLYQLFSINSCVASLLFHECRLQRGRERGNGPPSLDECGCILFEFFRKLGDREQKWNFCHWTDNDLFISKTLQIALEIWDTTTDAFKWNIHSHEMLYLEIYYIIFLYESG